MMSLEDDGSCLGSGLREGRNIFVEEIPCLFSHSNFSCKVAVRFPQFSIGLTPFVTRELGMKQGYFDWARMMYFTMSHHITLPFIKFYSF